MTVGWKLILIAAALGATTHTAMAQDNDLGLPGTFTGNVAIASDTTFRGYTQTQEDPAIQGGLDWDSGFGVYLGTWASNVNFGIPSEGSLRTDVYGGYKGAVGGFTYDVGAIAYLFPGTPKVMDYQWWEGYVKVGYDFDIAALTAGIAYTPDYFGGLDNAMYYSSALKVPLPVGIDGLSIGATIGYQDYKGLDSVLDYSVGLTYAMDWFTTDVRFVNTDGSNALCRNVCDKRVIVKISRAF